jgi:hypothetical protein
VLVFDDESVRGRLFDGSRPLVTLSSRPSASMSRLGAAISSKPPDSGYREAQ